MLCQTRKQFPIALLHHAGPRDYHHVPGINPCLLQPETFPYHSFYAISRHGAAGNAR